LVTPNEGMLEGISRRTVIEMARAMGLETQLRALPADELRGAEEVFISTSGGGVLPVTRVDKRPVGDGRPGPITQRLVQTYWAWHADPAYSQPIDYSL
ncbi:MAG: aminotransferase class IV, partial [Burkholderiaceae bacterium]|nr:aminotransferase class IV [Burkholderiaceae bacterium]